MGVVRVGHTRRAVIGGGTALVLGGAAAMFVRRAESPTLPGRITLAAGPLGAVFVEVGHDVGRAVSALTGMRVDVLTTAASVENVRMLAAGQADLGFASLDAAAGSPQVALESPGASSSPGRVLAVARVYDSLLHLVVLAASPLGSVAALAGRTVAVGASGSGTEFTCLRLLQALGVRPAAEVRLAQQPAMEALAAGTVDAAFTLTGIPTPAVTDLARTRSLRLVPVDTAFDVMDQLAPGVYSSTSIPATTYPGVAGAATIAVPNLLLARAGLAAPVVSAVVGALLSPDARRYWTHPESRRIDVRSAVATGPVRLHPAAQQWLRAHKP